MEEELGQQAQMIEFGPDGLPLFFAAGEAKRVFQRTAPVDGAAADAAAGGSLVEQVAALEQGGARLRQAERALLDSNAALTLLSETATELLASDRPQR
ncbi:MAG: hypothetical protein M1401_09090 [Chloroflexi bacterium]|nr:hypothetical protein [Chloroflexota bacterium]